MEICSPKDAVSILIAEDSKTQAAILRHLLESAGYLVTVASNGREAFELIQKNPPTIVLTDVMMPEMNGYELCRTIKDDPTTRDIPVILVTQLFDPTDVIEGLACGADNFIIKPYEPDYLLDRVAVILSNNTLDSDVCVGVGDETGIPVFFNGKNHIITSNSRKILNVLLSTYEIAIYKNNELLEAKEKVAVINYQLSEANVELLKSNSNLKNEILERNRIEQALFQSNKKLSLLSSITRHDMKNTMMALLSYNELARMDNPAKEFQDYLTKESEILSRLSAQIEFTRLYEELGVKGAIWIDLFDLLNKVILSFSSVTISLESDIRLYEIFVDPLVEKVFYNLLDNAIRHGEKVTTILISAKEMNENLEISISDDGIGVPDEDKEMIFSRGYGKNTGLGLFLVREILSITNILITECGIPGKGALFVLKVPSVHYRKSHAL
ncbi:hybrid sensor histidine kinase/response regulator [Methanospirillum stamsii]|uniref:Hybrid sensor histidine kinase/response regulator n=1 Tax=Methanospirillum stamsii TaxID=1277351 RepID=A0A2V2N952_9EURY|nr:hybrid sensor histidine kinase/response regulator [Methanospirillum stamsii]PWR71803.1 hybrid sensor histidine kinase/response regulator [Methanospirillum stamsii]